MLTAAEDPAFNGALNGFLTHVTSGHYMIETPCEAASLSKPWNRKTLSGLKSPTLICLPI